MKKVKVEYPNVFLKSFDRYIITEFIVRDEDFFTKYTLNKESLLTNLETRKKISRKTFNLMLQEKLFKTGNKGEVRTPDAPITNLFLQIRSLSLKFLYITNDEQDFKEKQSFIESNNLTNITVVIFKGGQLYHLEKSKQPTTKQKVQPPVTTPTKKTPSLRTKSNVPQDDDEITFIINPSFETKLIKVLFRNHKERSDSTKYYLLPADAKTNAVKLKNGKFEYKIKFGEIKFYDYIFILTIHNGVHYTAFEAVYINYKKNKHEYSVNIDNNNNLIVRNKGKVDDFIDSSVPEMIVNDDEKFKYYGGQPFKDAVPTNKEYKIPTVGAKLYTKDKKVVELADPVANPGGEAIIYHTRNKEGYVAKIYSNKTLNGSPNKEEALKYFISRPVKNPYVIWPCELLYYQNQFVGFLMPEVEGNNLFSFVRDHKKGIGKYSKLEIVNLIIQMLEIFQYLHARNIIIGDTKPQNFMYNQKERKLYIIDTDSFQLDKYCEKLESPGFTPREYHSCINEYTRFSHDNYQIFSLIVYLLTKQHPYAARGKAVNGSFEPLVAKGDYSLAGSKKQILELAPGIMDTMWLYLPGYLREAFINVASRKGKNYETEKRLSATEWLTLFRHYRKDLQSGKLGKISPYAEKGMIINGEADPKVMRDFDNLYETFGNLKMDNVLRKRIKGVNLTKLVEEAISKSNIKNHNNITIVEQVKKTGLYDADDVKIELIKNLGIFYELEINYKM